MKSVSLSKMVETTGFNNEVPWTASSSDEPLETAVLYDSYKSRVACGHVVLLHRMVQRLQEGGETTCPICQKSIGYVSDAAAAAASSNQDVVVFKFGKTVYRLSVAEPAVRLRRRPWWSRFIESNTTTTDRITAQKRISDVLGISRGMKILHKGKVLYPLPPGAASVAVEQELSDKLVSMSKAETTVSLTVMGTPTERQNLWLKNENEQKFHLQIEHPKDFWTLVTTTTVADVFQFGMYLFHQSVHFLGAFAWHCFSTVRNSVSGWIQSPSHQGHDHVQ